LAAAFSPIRPPSISDFLIFPSKRPLHLGMMGQHGESGSQLPFLFLSLLIRSSHALRLSFPGTSLTPLQPSAPKFYRSVNPPQLSVVVFTAFLVGGRLKSPPQLTSHRDAPPYSGFYPVPQPYPGRFAGALQMSTPSPGTFFFPPSAHLSTIVKESTAQTPL